MLNRACHYRYFVEFVLFGHFASFFDFFAAKYITRPRPKTNTKSDNSTIPMPIAVISFLFGFSPKGHHFALPFFDAFFVAFFGLPDSFLGRGVSSGSSQ